jgi:DNA-directed RNA polymerase specialized sigma24 family protein
MLSEKELITALKNRTKEGAAALYDQYAVMIYKVIRCNIKDEALAGQVLEHVFHKLWNSFDEFEDQSYRLSIWIMGVTRALSKVSYTEVINIRDLDGDNNHFEFAVKPV